MDKGGLKARLPEVGPVAAASVLNYFVSKEGKKVLARIRELSIKPENDLPATLRTLRATLNLTQEQLGERLGVSFATVNRWEGGAGTREFAMTHTHAPDKYHKHLVLNILVELHGDTASVSSYMFRFDASNGEKSYVWGMGRYLDTMRRDPDGRWRIRSRYPDIEAIRSEAPLGAEPFPDSPQARRALGGAA